jgi:hypothetical protein
MRNAAEILPAQITIGEALERMRSSPLRAWPITDGRGVVGVISWAALQQGSTKGAAAELLGDLVDAGTFPHVWGRPASNFCPWLVAVTCTSWKAS